MSRDFGRFTWFELITKDTDKALAYYGEVAGWKVQMMEMEGAPAPYPLLMVGDQAVGGINKPPKPEVPPHWVSYVSVEDVEKTAKAVIKNGGKSLMDAIDVPTVGRIQPVMDPEGAAFFLFRSAEEDRPAATGAGSFHWNELWSKDPERQVAFYEKVFGYTHETMEMPDGTYFMLKNGDQSRGGVMKSPMDAPSHWQQYVTVDDCDAAIGRAKRAGGTVLSDAVDVPGVGRFGIVKDTVGGVMGFIKPAAA